MDVTLAFWRAAQAFRIVSLLYALGWQAGLAEYHVSARLSWTFFAMQVVWTGVTATVFSLGRARAGRWAIADAGVICALMFGSWASTDAAWYTSHQVNSTTLWSANAVLSCAIAFGWRGGAIAGVLVSVSHGVVKQLDGTDLYSDATLPVHTAIGLAVGIAASTGRDVQERLRVEIERSAAARAAAATAREREEFVRQVHDGVLQVLALVSRQGRLLGPDGVRLAEQATVQERRLRSLLVAVRAGPHSAARQASAVGAVGASGATAARGATGPAAAASTDLAESLRLLGADSPVPTAVSTPADPVPVPTSLATALTAAVSAALANTGRHAGPGARAWVLVEDLADSVAVTVRDDGTGFTPDREEEARAEGRLGICASIRGRIDDLGGTARLYTAPGDGVEWEFTVPRPRSETPAP